MLFIYFLEISSFITYFSIFQFEERKYKSEKWVCTSGINSESGLFMKLFNYISGSNAAGENIDMTTPVSTRWEALAEGDIKHEKCFYLNHAHQGNPPKPSESDVYIVQRPEMTIYTRCVSF